MPQRHQRAKEFSEQATNILSAAWRKNTKSTYEEEIKRYVGFCYEREADPYNSNDTVFIEFLTQELERGMSSSAIKGMIIAMKKINSQASTELIRTFKKGAFNVPRPVTVYHKIWDPDVLLSYLESMDTSKPIQLSMKTESVAMLLSGHRVNTLENLKITNMYISETECTFVFSSVLKHSRPCYHQQPLILRSFPSNPSLCPVRNITQYLKFRLEKFANEGLQLSHHTSNTQKILQQDGSKKHYLSLASTVGYTRFIVFVQLLRHQPCTKE